MSQYLESGVSHRKTQPSVERKFKTVKAIEPRQKDNQRSASF
ncbi:hypothetical protein [Anabaena sp. CCY 0017]